jgi:hypothetical protein
MVSLATLSAIGDNNTVHLPEQFWQAVGIEANWVANVEGSRTRWLYIVAGRGRRKIMWPAKRHGLVLVHSLYKLSSSTSIVLSFCATKSALPTYQQAK